MEKSRIASFRDLHVYQNSYDAMLQVMKQIVPLLPNSERFDLKDQLSRSSKAVPRLIAEGYAKRHQRSGFQKYLDDAMAECNESIVSLEQCRDLYEVPPETVNNLVDLYDKCGRQIYKLRKSWNAFRESEKQF